MTRYLREHPLATVMITAVILRLIAAMFSKGYMASDDHFQTVHVAYYWLQNGIWGADGYLTWKRDAAWTISRFPLYTLSLYVNMGIMYLLGYEALDKIMYGVRLGHGLFSLIAVWAVYRIVELSTRSRTWAVAGGLIMAAHFAVPYLAVRNLIEMVGGTIWVAAFYYFYRYRQDSRSKWLIYAGIVSGLAWMIRFQLLFAFWIIPIVLWIENRNVRPALSYGLSVAAMLAIAGLVDLMTMGTFMGTSVNHVRQGLAEGALYHTHFLIYAAVILAYFIPPFSLIAFYLAGSRRFFSRHRLLTVSTLSFIVIHSVLPSRQERFMIPIIPVLVLIIILALHQHYTHNGFLFRKKRLLCSVLGFTLLVNLVLLFPLTLNYSHKGMVEPLVRIERMSDTPPRVLFFTPDKYRNFPYLYGGFTPVGRDYVFRWSDLDRVWADGSDKFDYFLLYPPSAEDLETYKDSISGRVGPIREVFRVSPSLVDRLLHLMNPKYNPANEVWAYSRVSE